MGVFMAQTTQDLVTKDAVEKKPEVKVEVKPQTPVAPKPQAQAQPKPQVKPELDTDIVVVIVKQGRVISENSIVFPAGSKFETTRARAKQLELVVDIEK